MQEEMRKYYTVSTFSGIPDRQKPLTCNKTKIKNENEDVASAENMNWMQALRFVAAKGHQESDYCLPGIHCRQENMTLR